MTEAAVVTDSCGCGENSRGLGAAEILNGIVASSETGIRQTMKTEFDIPSALPEEYLNNCLGLSDIEILALRRKSVAKTDSFGNPFLIG